MDHSATIPPTTTPPGWYRDPELPGCLRWWDGSEWTAHRTPAADGGSVGDERTMAVLAHLLGLLTGFVGPLVIYLTVRPGQQFAKHHAAEALNFQLTVMLATTVAGVLWIAGIFLRLVSPLFGLLLFAVPVVLLAVVMVPAISSMAARRGEWYRAPLTIRMVRGARG